MFYSISVSKIMQGKTYPIAGEYLYGILVSHFDQSEKIILDLKDVDLVPSMFLNTSIGRLINERGLESVRKRLAFRNASQGQIQKIKSYVHSYE